MAQVTVELRNLLKSDFQLFDFEYTFDDQAYKKELEQRVIDWFYDYEIGQETPEMFKHKFKTRWIKMIGYYNKLYNTTLLQYNPLSNYNLTEVLDQLSEHNNTENTQGSSTTRGNSDSEFTGDIDQTGTTDDTRTDDLTRQTDGDEKMSDYPQQNIAGGDYLSGERKTTNTEQSTGTVKNTGSSTNGTTTNNTETVNNEESTGSSGKTTNDGTDNTNYTKTIEGITGVTYQELIKAERENIVHITSGVIEEMKPCFIMIY